MRDWDLWKLHLKLSPQNYLFSVVLKELKYKVSGTAKSSSKRTSSSSVSSKASVKTKENLLKLRHDTTEAKLFAEQPQKLIELSKRFIYILLWHGFLLTKWVSNSCEILNSLPRTEISPKLEVLTYTLLPLKEHSGWFGILIKIN